MHHQPKSIENSLKIVWPIVYAGAAIGFLLSWGVLSGDQQGRVNLFYLLLVYLFIPVVSVLASSISLVFGKGVNLARLVTMIPMWTFKTQTLIRKVHQFNLDKYWFLMQSQIAAIAFSLASLVTFFVLLLATDINFVWRSTILEAADIFPLLETVAWPWSFWPSAQPDLALLEMTQDSRMDPSIVSSNTGFTAYAGWWQFILATQLVYSLTLRIVLLTGSRWWLKRTMNSDFEQRLQSQLTIHQPIENELLETSPIVHQLPTTIAINNWACVQPEILGLLSQLNLSPDNQLFSGPLATPEQQNTAEQWRGEQLVIVKAWEPPLGELEDFLQNGQGYLLPLDWDDSGLTKPAGNHFHEWQRLINKLPRWQLYLPENLA